jgi:hypothetical protein
MAIGRREFLKIVGIGVVTGVVSSFGGVLIGRGKDILKEIKSSPSKVRWAMAIDTKQFKTEEDFSKVIEACHKAHNVPQIPDPIREVKWIWIDTFERAFPTLEHEFISEEVKKEVELHL